MADNLNSLEDEYLNVQYNTAMSHLRSVDKSLQESSILIEQKSIYSFGKNIVIIVKTSNYVIQRKVDLQSFTTDYPTIFIVVHW